MAQRQFPVGMSADNRHLRGRGDVVTAAEIRETGQTVVVRQPVRIAAQHKSSAHR